MQGGRSRSALPHPSFATPYFVDHYLARRVPQPGGRISPHPRRWVCASSGDLILSAEKGAAGMRALLCHCHHHLEAEDDEALCVVVREHSSGGTQTWSLLKNRPSRSSGAAPT